VDGFEAAVRKTVSRALNIDPAKRPTATVLNYDFVVAFSEFSYGTDSLIVSTTKNEPSSSSGSSRVARILIADLITRLTDLELGGSGIEHLHG